MDSVGIGELPDASAYGDEGSNTLGNIAKQVPLAVPTLRALGLDRLVAILAGEASIREVIAFPKTANALDLMAGAPSTVDLKQLRELHLRIQN